MILTPVVPGQRPADQGRCFVLPLQYHIILLYKDLLMINPFLYINMPGRSCILRQTIQRLLNGPEIPMPRSIDRNTIYHESNVRRRLISRPRNNDRIIILSIYSNAHKKTSQPENIFHISAILSNNIRKTDHLAAIIYANVIGTTLSSSLSNFHRPSR